MVNAYVTNPFASESQRRFMWSQHPDIAEDWAHGEHSSEGPHKMPSETGKDVKGPLAKAEREEQKKAKKVRNSFFGNFWDWVTGNAFSRDSGGRFTKESGEELSEEETEALHRQLGPAKLAKDKAEAMKSARNQDQGEPRPSAPQPIQTFGTKKPKEPKSFKAAGAGSAEAAERVSKQADTLNALNLTPTGNAVADFLQVNQLVLNSRMTECEEECDEDDDECIDDCLTDNADQSASQPRHPQDGTYQGKAHIAAKKGYNWPLDEEGDDCEGEPIGDEDDEIGQGDRPPGKGSLKHNMVTPPTATDQHYATKQAAGASMMTDHDKAIGHSDQARAASSEGDSEGAAQFHDKAAKAHEKQATAIRGGQEDGNPEEHDMASALHRKAASMHLATRNSAVKLTTNERKGMVDSLLANGSPAGRAALSRLSDSDLMNLKNNAKDDEYDSSVDEEERTRMEKHGLHNHKFLKGLLANCSCAATRNEIKEQLRNAKAEGSNADITSSGGKSVQAGGEEDEDDPRTGESDEGKGLHDDDEVGDAKVKGKRIPPEQSIINKLTRDERDVWNAMTENQQRVKQQLASALVDNSQYANLPAQREIVFNRLMKKSLSELKEMVEFQIPARRRPDPVYVGNAGGPEMGTRIQNSADDDLLIPPTLNYQEMSENDPAGKKASKGKQAG